MFEKIDKLRKAPQPVKEKLVSLITISIVAAVTVVWFSFTVSSFFKKSPTPPTPVSAAASSTSQTQSNTGKVEIKAPFAP
ncbi:hypothetical protein HY090_01860 [Candidatus Kaiserbacteria bacterium]|nr:hypothetical protein [Candidatus Kaiserbacteria bacterium]